LESVPPELKFLIQEHEQALREIAKLPFTLEELQWLSENKDVITFFKSPKQQYDKARTELHRSITTDLREHPKTGILTLKQIADYYSTRVIYYIYTHQEYEDDKLMGFVSVLDIVAKNNCSIIHTAQSRPFFVLDTKSIFMLFKKRFQELGLRDPVPAAREETIRAMNYITAFFTTPFQYQLERYLADCLSDFDEIDYSSEKTGPRVQPSYQDEQQIITEETLNECVDRCNSHVAALRQAIFTLN